MQVVAEIEGVERVVELLRRYPRHAHAAVAAYLLPLNEEFKDAISRTFRGRRSSKTLRGRKWLYKKGNPRGSRLRSTVHGETLDTLQANVFTRATSVRGQVEPTTILPRKSGFLALPDESILTAKGNVKRRYIRGPGSIPNTRSRRRGNHIQILEQRGAKEQVIFHLVRKIVTRGGRLDSFVDVIERKSFRVRTALSEALGVALKRSEQNLDPVIPRALKR